MFLGFIALVFSTGITPVSSAEPVVATSFDVSKHLKAQLQQRNMMSNAQLVQSPVVSQKLFTHYPNFQVSGALINQALNKDLWLEEGPHFDPAYNKTLNQKVLEPFLQKRGIKEVLAVGVSGFAGSKWGRMANIEASIKQFDGLIIPRGEHFSFNKTLGEVTEEKGFEWARVLRNGKNDWGLGGGICQVSTNVFRAALNAGLDITDRRAHSIIIDKYAPTGLDSTIYLGHQDLQFVNNTPGDVLMKFVLQDEKLITVFYGTKDTRQVRLEKTKHWEGYDGRTATDWHRTVQFRDSAMDDVFKSSYRPVAVEEELVAN